MVKANVWVVFMDFIKLQMIILKINVIIVLVIVNFATAHQLVTYVIQATLLQVMVYVHKIITAMVEIPIVIHVKAFSNKFYIITSNKFNKFYIFFKNNKLLNM